MTTDEKFQALLQALTNIRDKALDHPCCDHVLYESEDVDALCDIGGDVCDWTMLAIIANEAIQKVKGVE